MVANHRPSRPQRIVVKANRAPRPKPGPTRRCAICGNMLRADRYVGVLTCDCHHRDPYNPRHDPHFDRHVLTLLVAAYPEPLNLLRALNTSDRWAVRDCVNRWRGRGVSITGWLHVGYVLGSATVAGGDGAKVRA